MRTATLILVAVLATLTPEARAQCTTSWANPASGDWNVAANWDNGVPGAASDACITVDGTYTVTKTSGSIDVASLALGGSSGTQTLLTNQEMRFGTTGTVNPNGVLEWTARYVRAGTLLNQGVVRLTGNTASRGVQGDGVTTPLFRNEGTVMHADNGQFYMYQGGRAENAATWTVTGDGDYFGFNSTPGVFANEAGATFEKTGGAGITRFGTASLTVTNAGTIDVQSGEVDFDVPSTHTDAVLTTGAGATLRFSSGSPTFEGTTTGAQAGELVVQVDFFAGAGAEWALTGNGVNWTASYIRAGALTNAGVVRLTGNTASRGVQGLMGSTPLFRNEGTVTHADNGQFYMYQGGRAENAATWTVTGDGDYFGFNSTPGVFANEAGATFEKTGGAGITRFGTASLTVTNAGTVDVQSGEVDFDVPSTHTDAVLTTGAGATLRFSSGSPTFEGTTTGAQAGELVVQVDFFAGAGAEWALTGNGVNWTASYLRAGALTNAGVVRLTGNTASRGVQGLMGSTPLFRNEGTVTHADNGQFYMYQGGRAENAATWTVTGDGDYFGFNNTPGVFANEAGATFEKTGGAGATRFGTASLTVTNAGTISVESGEIDVDVPFDHQDGALIQGTGIFDVAGSTFAHAGDTGPGLSPGVLTWQGDFVPAGTSSLNIEIVDDGGAGAANGHDQLAVTGDVDVTQSALVVTATTDACDTSSPCTYTILTFTGTFTGPFASTTLPPNATVAYPADPGGAAGEIRVIASGPLPVELVAFTATLDGTAALLAWETASETSNAGFSVEHRVPEAQGWVEAGFVTGAGTTEDGQSYTFRLDGLASGTHTFRLRQVDFDGAFAYSDEVEVEVGPPAVLALAAWPNPVRDAASLRLDLPAEGPVRVDLYDALGRRVATLHDGSLAAGTHPLALEARALPAGTYLVRAQTASGTTLRRISVVR